MNLIQRLETVATLLTSKKVYFALAGGLATSIYRKEKRTTENLDFLIYRENQSEKIARTILSELNLEVREARKANLEGGPVHAIKRNSSPIYILVGRKDGEIGVDFILPEMPWSKQALERAQSNLTTFNIIDLKLPCLTVEDILIAKFYSLGNDSSRHKDADDIQSIFKNDNPIDFSYLTAQMMALDLCVPRAAEKSVPAILLKTSKTIRRNIVKENRS